MTTATARREQATASTPVRVPFSDPAYGEVMDFLVDEANLLDTDRHEEWLDLMANDIEYRVPPRQVRYRRGGPAIDPTASTVAAENILTLQFRVERSVKLECALDREPPPVVRRFITNVAVRRTAKPDEFEVSNYLLLLWVYNAKVTATAPGLDILSARREDLVRRTADGMRLARRTVLVDHASMTSFPNVFF